MAPTKIGKEGKRAEYAASGTDLILEKKKQKREKGNYTPSSVGIATQKKRKGGGIRKKVKTYLKSTTKNRWVRVRGVFATGNSPEPTVRERKDGKELTLKSWVCLNPRMIDKVKIRGQSAVSKMGGGVMGVSGLNEKINNWGVLGRS